MENQMLSLEQALSNMLSRVTCVEQTSIIPLDEALDRVLAQSIVSDINVPSSNNSAMDGYAVLASDVTLGQPLNIVGQVLAGQIYSSKVPAGCCVRITTGAPIPEGLNSVIMQEHVEQQHIGQSKSIICNHVPAVGDYVRLAGEDIAKGQEIFSIGRKLRSVDLGLLASLGFAKIKVFKQLTVAIFSCGDELTTPGNVLMPGCIYDSNRYVMAAMLKRLGADVLDLGVITDDPIAIEKAFKRAMQLADVLITSAGVSVGDADYIKPVLSKLGKVNFWKVAMKPGKPFVFGELENCWLFGLPGNPVATVVTLEQLVQPVLRKISGEVVQEQENRLLAECQTPLTKQIGRLDYQRGWYWQSPQGLKVKAVGSQSSSTLSSIANANCYIILERESGNLSAGEIVSILPFSIMLR